MCKILYISRRNDDRWDLNCVPKDFDFNDAIKIEI